MKTLSLLEAEFGRVHRHIELGVNMSSYIEGYDRQQVTLLQECLNDFIAEDNTVRIVDVFINELDLVGLGFDCAKTGGNGQALVPSLSAAEAVPLRIPQPYPVQP